MAAGSAAAQGDLLVAPTRVVIANAGAGEVVLSNIGTAAATYRIGLELRRMTADGDIIDVAEDVSTAAERAALAMVHYAPRRITLQPGQPQAVRIAVRPPQDLPDGEYRVHMSFRAVPAAALEGDAQHLDASAAASGVSIKLVPVYGITIPVIVRKGALVAAGTLTNPHVVRGERGAYLEVALVRSGQRSLYGEIIGKTARGAAIFNLKGVAIYPEVANRMVRIPLTPAQLGKVAEGPIQIEYRELPENGGQLIAALTGPVRQGAPQ